MLLFLFRLVLFLPMAFSLLFGVQIIQESTSTIQEQTGLQVMLIGAVFLTGYITVEALFSVHKELRRMNRRLEEKNEVPSEEAFLG